MHHRKQPQRRRELKLAGTKSCNFDERAANFQQKKIMGLQNFHFAPKFRPKCVTILMEENFVAIFLQQANI